MKRVLITGANSYIGRSFMAYVANDDQLEVAELDVRDSSWKMHDFSTYDTVFHVAAIVHKNEMKVDSQLYYLVNRDLPVQIAQKAHEQGVGQFIFLSSMSVYGDSIEEITFSTIENPVTHYGKSKLEAEKLLISLVSDNFKVVILRPPMVYGPNATGNYARLSRLSKVLGLFPKINNQRSMIFIDNLSEFIFCAIQRELSGLYFPQNKDYVSTQDLVKEIRLSQGKKILLLSAFNPFINLFLNSTFVRKLFGNLVYSQEMSKYGFPYQLIDFKTSILKSENIELNDNIMKKLRKIRCKKK